MQLKSHWLWRTQLPTWLAIIGVYVGWFSVVIYWQWLGTPIATVLLILLTCFYMSVQHELIHGYPTRYARLNQLLGLLPLAVWFPYGLYRDTHIRHHINEHLTDPQRDPESYYLNATQVWARYAFLRGLTAFSNTFIGRIIVGPAIAIVQTLIGLVKSVRVLDISAITMWLVHGILLGMVLAFLQAHGVGVLYFLLAVAYPALALTKIRSFFEHRAHECVAARSVINHVGWGWRWLFLNLNFHSVHHDLPRLPWFWLRKVYMRYQAEYDARSESFVLSGYTAMAVRHLTVPVIETVHPNSEQLSHELSKCANRNQLQTCGQ